MEEEMDDTKRKCRNLSEKKRRDQFNVLLNELSTIVSTSSRKMDKSTVLKATISFLKNHNDTAVLSRVHDIQEEWKPSFLSNEEFTHLLLEALDGFIMVFSASGFIHFASESVISLLGYLPADIMHQSIFDLAYEDDRAGLYGLLQNLDPTDDSMQAVVLKENQIKFQCHIRRGRLDFREEPSYELVQFVGYLRTSTEPLDGERSDLSVNQDSRLLFVCTGQLLLPQLIRDMPPSESVHCEFISQLSLEWKYLFLDHRAPPIIGYLPFEMLGTSGYDYYHFDDLDKVASCHHTLMKKGELTSCYYRFLTKGQQWIWLQTRFYINYHQWSSKPEFIVCSHRVVSYVDVLERMKCEREAAMCADAPDGPCPKSDFSMSPSYVSECSDEYESRLTSSAANSYKSMSLGSASGSTVMQVVPLASGAADGAANMAAHDAPPDARHDAAYDAAVYDAAVYDAAAHDAAHDAAYNAAAHDAAYGAAAYDAAAYDAAAHDAAYNAAAHDATYDAAHDATHDATHNATHDATHDTAHDAVRRRTSLSAGAASSVSSVESFKGHVAQEARLRYSSTEGSAPSVDARLRQRARAAERSPGATQLPELQSTMGVQYLEPARYVVPGPVAVTPVQVQLQLQRKHEELQQMIVMQQEELRRIAEQLLVSRLGLPPIINMQYGDASVNRPTQLIYDLHLGAPLQLAPSLELPSPQTAAPLSPATTPLPYGDSAPRGPPHCDQTHRDDPCVPQ